MKSLIVSTFVWLASVEIGFGQNLEIDYDHSASSVALTWNSVHDRTYFLQMSDSMDDWEFCPLIWYGDGTIKGQNFSVPSGENLFYRLVHTDYEVAGGNPGAEDFDNDGLTNWNEVSGSHGTDPFLKDTDRD